MANRRSILDSYSTSIDKAVDHVWLVTVKGEATPSVDTYSLRVPSVIKDVKGGGQTQLLLFWEGLW